MTPDELHRLLAAAKAESTRDWLMLLVSYHHALRVSECINLKADNIRDGYLTVARGKGSLKTRQRLVPDADPLLDEATALTAWIAGKNSHEYLWRMCRQQVGRLMHYYAEKANVPYDVAHPHALRHSCAIHSLKIHKLDICDVQQYLGHVSLGSTGLYLRTTDEDASNAYINARKGIQQ